MPAYLAHNLHPWFVFVHLFVTFQIIYYCSLEAPAEGRQENKDMKICSAVCERLCHSVGRIVVTVEDEVSGLPGSPFIFLCPPPAPLNHWEMRGPKFYLCPSVSLFVHCRSKSNIMYKIQTGQLFVSCRERALKEISWLPDLLNEVWVLVSIPLGNDMWIESLYKQAFIFVNGWKLVKKREEGSVYCSISSFISVKQKWVFLNPLVVPVLKFHFFCPSARSC